MQKITPHLWFDRQAKEAAQFYTSLLGGKITNVTTLHNTPGGDTDIVSFELAGESFMAISAGPLFKFNPSISFFINFDPSTMTDAKGKLDEIWNKLSHGGKILMPLDKYPFSEHYGWVQDKYGLSWQLILTNPKGDKRPMIVPSLLFVGASYGKAEEAVKFYLSVFKDSKMGNITHYGPGQEPNKEGTTMFADFKLFETWIAAMDGGGPHKFIFNEAISFIVKCKDQKEIDYYWEKLTSDGGEESMCGWLKDKFGVSWQIVPEDMDKTMAEGDQEKIDRVTKAFLKMKKFDIAELQKAAEGR